LPLKAPSDVLSYLTSDEKLLKSEKIPFQSKEIYVTDKRIIIKEGKGIVEASYRHISSIEYKKEGNVRVLIMGIISIDVSLLGFYTEHIRNII